MRLTLSQLQNNSLPLAFLEDAVQILKTNTSVLDKAPLQLYSSVLLFSPKNSIVRCQFVGALPCWISSYPRTEGGWGPLRQILACEDEGTNVAWSYDSKLVGSRLANRPAQVWRIDTGECVNKLPAKGSGSIAELLAIANYSEAEIGLWSTTTNECITNLDLSPAEGYHDDGRFEMLAPFGRCLAFSEDSRLMTIFTLLGETTTTVIRCYSTSGEILWDFMERSCWTSSAAFSGDMNMIATISKKGIRTWQVTSSGPTQPRVLDASGDNHFSMAPSHDGKLMVVTRDGDFRIHHTDTLECIEHISRKQPLSTVLSVSADSVALVCCGANHVYLWDEENVKGAKKVMPQSSDIVALSHDSSLVISDGDKNSLYVWSARMFMTAWIGSLSLR